LESIVNKESMNTEREKAVLFEKYNNLENQYKELLANNEIEIAKLRATNE